MFKGMSWTYKYVETRYGEYPRYSQFEGIRTLNVIEEEQELDEFIYTIEDILETPSGIDTLLFFIEQDSSTALKTSGPPRRPYRFDSAFWQQPYLFRFLDSSTAKDTLEVSFAVNSTNEGIIVGGPPRETFWIVKDIGVVKFKKIYPGTRTSGEDMLVKEMELISFTRRD